MNRGSTAGDMSGPVAAVGAAVLFGLAAPFAKLLLQETPPLMLSALLYLGAGLALNLFVLAWPRPRLEARLTGSDWLPMVAIIVTGGMAGPLLMLLGLARVSAVVGSLLLNLEAPFTMLLAVALFGEHLGLSAAVAACAIVVGGALVGYRPGELRGDWVGAIEIAGACLAWAADNNLSQQLSLKDPLDVGRAKTLGAGVCVLIIALLAGTRFPGLRDCAAALALGAGSYGLSLVLALKAMRSIGAARESAYFSTAPFIGALVAVPLFGEWPRAVDWIAACLMAMGLVALTRERHEHLHGHERLEHEHFHYHDVHHQHLHAEPHAEEPHSHWHRHPAYSHAHRHHPDAHHRHSHK
jgi:drug/metabolite transporter (DMT)-like permease